MLYLYIYIIYIYVIYIYVIYIYIYIIDWGWVFVRVSEALEPEVIELVHYFKISDRHARMLNEQLKRLGWISLGAREKQSDRCREVIRAPGEITQSHGDSCFSGAQKPRVRSLRSVGYFSTRSQAGPSGSRGPLRARADV